MPTYIKREEQVFRDALKLDLDRHGVYCRVLHGNMYQSGLPDLVAVAPCGMTFFMELKYWNRVTTPTIEQCLSLLKGPQQMVIRRELWGRNAPCLLVTQHHADPSIASIVFKSRITSIPWAIIASASARTTTFTELLHVFDLQN